MVSWGWYYLSTVLDDYARYIIAWALRTSMQAADVIETLELARAKTGIDQVRVVHRPRLLSDNGPCYVSGELAAYLERHRMPHTRGAPYHPMTQGKIERYHRSMKNVVRLEKYYSPWELDGASDRMPAIESFDPKYSGTIRNKVRSATLAGIPAIAVDPGKVPGAKLLIDVVDILVPSGARGPSTRASHRCG